MIDATERQLLAQTVHAALESAAEPDTALADVGWLDMLHQERSDAIAIVFDALGQTNAPATVLTDVYTTALGLPADAPTVFPPFGSVQPGGRSGLAFATRAAGLSNVEPIAGIDPALGLVRAQAPARLTNPDPSAVRQAVADCQRALSYQLVGASRVMLAKACEHARGREQFNRPIASFQAVRHRLAEALVAIEAAADAVAAADTTADPLASTVARSLAGRAARIVGAQAQQVLAGIGFTTEHGFHPYLRRTIALDGLFGSATALTGTIGAQLLHARTAPRLIEL